MRLILLTALTMCAFAANSLLNRAALGDPAMGPASFAAIRLASGALALALLLAWRKGARPTASLWGTLSLALYAIGFSFAYITLDAGVGALILFGGVQITMFAGALFKGEAVSRNRWLGAIIAFAGLAYLLWPTSFTAPPLTGSALMLAAALGWGVYSLIGRQASDPLAATGGNFLAAAPIALLLWAFAQDSTTPTGIALAITSGVVTSALGYALWYAVLPRIDATIAAIAQLTVPIIAVAGGALLLAEPLTLRFAIAATAVVGGVLISLRKASTPQS